METTLPGSAPTDHELNVLRIYAETGSTKEVGARLGISNQTVKNLLWKVRMRLDVGTTVEAVWKLRRELETAGG